MKPYMNGKNKCKCRVGGVSCARRGNFERYCSVCKRECQPKNKWAKVGGKK